MGYSLLRYMGGPCQQFVADPQILSHRLQEHQTLRVKSLRPKIYSNIFWTTTFIKISLNITASHIQSLINVLLKLFCQFSGPKY